MSYTSEEMERQSHKAGETAKELLKATISGLAEAAGAGETAEKVRLFFPDGIHYINVTVKSPVGIEVGLTVSGDPKKVHQESLAPESLVPAE